MDTENSGISDLVTVESARAVLFSIDGLGRTGIWPGRKPPEVLVKMIEDYSAGLSTSLRVRDVIEDYLFYLSMKLLDCVERIKEERNER